MLQPVKNSVLVIDDQVLSDKMLTNILSPEYIVYTANNGKDGIESAEKYLPDVILLDIVMPEMDGYEVIQRLKNSEKTRNIPIIFLTGLSNFIEEEKGFALGAADYISKPFSAAIVKLRVQNQLKILKQQRIADYELMNYKLAGEAMKIALWRMDVLTPVMVSPEDKNIWTWSQEVRNMLGFTDENDFPDTIEAFLARMHPEDSEKAIAAFASHFNDRSGNTPYDIEYRLRHKNGEYRYFDGFGTALRDSEGFPLRVSGAMRDITEKKQMEKMLGRQNNLLRAVNLTASVLLTAKDDEAFKASLSNGMEIIGRSLDMDCVEIWQNEIIDGKTHAVLKHYWLSEVGKKIKSTVLVPSFAYDITPEWESRLSQGEYIQGAISELSREDREFLNIFKVKTVLVIPIFVHDRFWGFCCIDDCRNFRTVADDEISILCSVCYMMVNAINQRTLSEAMRRAEIAEARDKAKSQFLATMSHEIRTPMNGIMGFAELALDTPDNDLHQVRDYISRIKESTKWLLNIINDILDISKIESGKMELKYLPFDLHDVISRCESIIMPTAKEKGLSFIVETEPLSGKKAIGDPVRLYQTLINLLSNAVKFTDSGMVKLSVAIRNIEEDKVWVFFEVKDDGIGMNREQIEKVFAPFIQADSGTTRNYGGTGLGLAITKSIVELMGGTLSVESTLGAGSVFSFEVLFDTIETSDIPNEPSKFDLMEKPLFNGLVLVCDDNVMNRQVISEHLATVGLRTAVAENGQKGVTMVTKRIEEGESPYDLIFMDMFMPVMDGIEAASKIAELDTGTPIVAMTANVMASDLENYRKHGMPDYVAKPFTSKELWRILLKYLSPLKIGDNDRHESDNVELQRKLRLSFIKNNLSKYDEICDALKTGDIEAAHRLAHGLKGNAGQIGKKELQKAAEKIEFLIKDNLLPIPKTALNVLNAELKAVLEELRPLLDEIAAHNKPLSLNAEQIAELFDKLEPLLDNLNPECVNFLDDLRAVPGTEELTGYIEDYDFESAALILKEIKR
ncbi:MAG: response regulator [Oscillospiraceae bacterium]|nr:response regulator [Oscillospiraceae bacterium]